MVYQEGRYCDNLFMVHQGITQGYHLTFTIFNVVVDEVICQWVTLVV